MKLGETIAVTVDDMLDMYNISEKGKNLFLNYY